jgi:hypothetical protein
VFTKPDQHLFYTWIQSFMELMKVVMELKTEILTTSNECAPY